MRRKVRVGGVCALSILLAACGDSSRQDDSLRLPAAPSDWPRVESSCGYSFRAPRDLRAVPVEPVDSCVELFATDHCRLTSDVGRYAPDLDVYVSEAEHRSSTVLVAGRVATVVEFRLAEARDGRAYMAAFHVSGIDPDSPEIELSLWTACTSAAARDELEAIFGTIEIVRRIER